MKAGETPNRLYIPQPFASGNGSDLIPIETISGDEVNFVDGFPSVYSSPPSEGGKNVLRGNINALGYLASVNEYFYRCGGINTFDPELAMKIDGYPRGAVLEVIENGVNYHRVVSLIDDNKVDFNSDILTEQQIAAGVTLGDIDGVNWAYCEQGVIDDKQFVCDVNNWNASKPVHIHGPTIEVAWYIREIWQIGLYKAYHDGYFEIQGGCDVSFGETPEGTEDTPGFGIIVCEGTEGPTPGITTGDENGTLIYQRGTMLNTAYASALVQTATFERGKVYGIYVLNRGMNVAGSTMKIYAKW